MRLPLFALLLVAPALASAQDVAPPDVGDEAPTAADELLLPEPDEPDEATGGALVSPSPGGTELARPDAVDPDRVARLLAGIEARRAALARDRGGADLEMAIAVNLYAGGALLALLATSLLVGVAFEGACINGVIDECTDGAAFLIGALPAAIGSLALFVGAYTTEMRARERHRILDLGERDIEASERALPGRFRMALAPGGFAARF